MSGPTTVPPFDPKTAATTALAGVALAALVGVALAGTAAASPAVANTDNTTDPPEVRSVTEADGLIEVAFDRPVRAADDGGDVGVDDVEVYVRPAGAPDFDVYEDNFTVASNSTTEGKVVLTNGSWGDLAPLDTATVNFTTDVEAAGTVSGASNVSVTSTSTVIAELDRNDTDGVYGAAADADGDPGDLTRTDVASALRSYVRSGGQSVDGVTADRSEVAALVRLYVQRAAGR